MARDSRTPLILRKLLLRWSLLVAAVLAAPVGALAQGPVLILDRGAWRAAAGAVTTIDFEGIAPAAGFTAFDTPTGVSRSGVNFAGISPSNVRFPNYLRVVDHRYSTGFNWGSGSILHGPPVPLGPIGEGGPNSHVRASLPANVTSVGSDIMSFVQYNSPFTVVVTTAGGAYTFNVPTAAYPNRAFVGVVSPVAIASIMFAASSGFPALDNFAFGGIGSLGAPTNLTVTVSGATVSFTWLPATTGVTPTGFLLEASLVAQGAVVASLNTPAASLTVPNVPNGTFFARVRAVNGRASSPPSNEVQFTVGATGCSAAPAAPSGLSASADGATVAMNWTAPAGGCPPIGYRIRVGTASGLTNLSTLQVGPVTSLSVPGAPPGTYFLTVVAENAFGTSAPSNEVQVTVGSSCALPGAPIAFTASSNRDVVTLMWEPSPSGGVSPRYVLEVGSRPGATDVGVSRVTVTGLQAAPVANGTYYLRVRGENSCGVGPASAERVVVVSFFFPG